MLVGAAPVSNVTHARVQCVTASLTIHSLSNSVPKERTSPASVVIMTFSWLPPDACEVQLKLPFTSSFLSITANCGRHDAQSTHFQCVSARGPSRHVPCGACDAR